MQTDSGPAVAFVDTSVSLQCARARHLGLEVRVRFNLRESGIFIEKSRFCIARIVSVDGCDRDMYFRNFLLGASG